MGNNQSRYFPQWISDLNESRISEIHREQLRKTKPKGKAGEEAVVVEMFGVGEYAWVPRAGLTPFTGINSNPNKTSLRGHKSANFNDGVQFLAQAAESFGEGLGA